MYFLLGVVLEIIFIIFFSLLGMASVPNVMGKSQEFFYFNLLFFVFSLRCSVFLLMML